MIDFNPLWELMAERDISANALFRLGFPQTTYYRVKAGRDVRISTLVQFCDILNCDLSDIVRYSPNKE